MKKMKIYTVIVITLLLAFISCKNSNNNSKIFQWRGPERSGVYQESNLLKSWPSEGPVMLWESDSIGNGYGSPVATNENVYVMGEVDSIGYLFAYDLKGKQIWKKAYGKEWGRMFPGSRTTPTIYKNSIYICSGFGKITCFNAVDGKEKWTIEMIKNLHGKNTRFGFSESLLVDEQNVYCMPGGVDTNIVALDKNTGKIVWISKGVGEEPSYCAPIIIKLSERNLLVTFSFHAILGIDIKDGKLLWSQKQEGEGDVHGNTPFYENVLENHYIYYMAAAGNGTEKLKLSKDGSKITVLWKNQEFGNAFTGFIKYKNFIYASGVGKQSWRSIDACNGVLSDTLKFDKGQTIMADSMLYCYNFKGEVGLIKPENGKMTLISKFKIKKGSKEHFAHPAIANGVLYIRHGNIMQAYNIKQEQ